LLKLAVCDILAPFEVCFAIPKVGERRAARRIVWSGSRRDRNTRARTARTSIDEHNPNHQSGYKNYYDDIFPVQHQGSI